MSVLTDCVCWVVTLPVDRYIYVLDAWWRKHFSRCWPFVRGIHRSLVNSPRKGQWRGALMFSLICAWTNGWVNHRRLFETPSQSLWRHCNDESFCDCLIVIEAVDALLPNGRQAINDKDGDSAATSSTSLVYPSNNEIRFPQYQCSNPEEYDDVTKCHQQCHQHFPRYWPFVLGIQRSPVNSSHKGQRRGALKLSLIYSWINDSVNNLEPGDLRRNRAHYDVTAMIWWNMQDINPYELQI